jgi:hypothetical protein
VYVIKEDAGQADGMQTIEFMPGLSDDEQHV